MKILITGGVGHIGTNICIEAMKRGHQIIAMDNLHREGVIKNLKYLQETYKDKFEFIWGDVRNPEDFDKLPKDIQGCVMGAANPGIPWSIEYPTYDFRTNAEGTVNTLEYLRKCGNPPTAYCSTNKTFSDIINTLPIKEEEKRYMWGQLPGFEYEELLAGLDMEDPYSGTIQSINELFPVSGFGKYGHSMYGISKLTGELYCTEYHTQYGLPMVILKMSCIFGLHQLGAIEQGWISYFLQKIGFGDGKLTFFGTGKQVRDVLDARDVAKLYMDCIENIDKCNGEIFTVGGGPENTLSLIEAVEAIERLIGKKASISHEPKRSADQDIYISSIHHVKEIMGWEPTIKFEQTLKDMWDEYGGVSWTLNK